MTATQHPATATRPGTGQAAPVTGSAVTPALTRDVKAPATNRAGRYVETAEYIKAAHRFLRAAGERVGDGMDIDNLAALDALSREATALLYDSAVKLHDGTDQAPGYSYGEIARALGVTIQTAWRRFGPKRTDPRTLHTRQLARKGRKEG
jgi:hypothetical protein